MPSQQTAIVIVHFCAFDACVRCVHSLLAQTVDVSRILVVDNDSDDGSGEALIAHFASVDNVEVICSPENRGFAGGANIGLAIAQKRGFEFAWIVNPDVVAESYALSALEGAAAAHSQIAIFGSQVFYLPEQPEERLRIWGAGGIVDVSTMTVTMRGTGEVDTSQYDSAQSCDYLPGCSLFVKLSALADLDYLPEDYFLYFEETDWCMNARSKGYDLLYVPQSIVFHDTSVDRMQAPMRVYYFNRGARLFWWRWSGPLRKCRLVLQSFFLKVPQAMWAFSRAQNAEMRKTFLAHLYAHLDFLRCRGGQATYPFIDDGREIGAARTETL